MVSSIGNSNYNFAGTMMPNQVGKTPVQTTSTDGVQVRITPANFRQVLGENSDVLLTPQNMKDMYEKGYLDVKKSRTVMESNEGTFTILAKAIGAIIGPSRSLGAITIDPNFMEMIKDPNAKIGAGYTRVSNETLEVLPSPASPPPPKAAVPPYMPPIWPKQIPDDQAVTPAKQPFNAVTMTRINLAKDAEIKADIKADALGTYNHNKPDDGDLAAGKSGIRISDGSDKTIKALRTGEQSGAFKVSVATNSNILRPKDQPNYNSDESKGLSQRRRRDAMNRLGIPQSEFATRSSQNGDHAHKEFLQTKFGLATAATGPIKVSGIPGPNAPSKEFVDAANELITTYHKDKSGNSRSVLQSDENLLNKDGSLNRANPQTKYLEAVAAKLPEGDRQKLYEYAQSFVDHRSFQAKVDIKPENLPQVEAWLAANKSGPVAESGVYKDIEAQVAQIKKTGTVESDGANTVATIVKNVDAVQAKPGPNGTPVKEDAMKVLSDIQAMQKRGGLSADDAKTLNAKAETLKGLIDKAPPEGLPSLADAEQATLVKNLNDAAHPGTEIDSGDHQALAGQIGKMPAGTNGKTGGDAIPKGPIRVGDIIYNDPDPKPDPTGKVKHESGKSWNDILKQTEDIAKIEVGTPGGTVAAAPEKIVANIQDNMGTLKGMVDEVAGGKRVNPESVKHFMDGIRADIARLPEGPQKKELGDKLDALTTKHPSQEVQTFVKAADRAATLEADGTPGASNAGGIGRSLDDFHRYVKEAVADGQIDFKERADMRQYITSTAGQLVAELETKGFKFNPVDKEYPERQLATVTPEMLANAKVNGKPAFEGKELDQMIKNVKGVNSASVAVNLCSEGTYTASLYQNVKHLDQQLTNFEKVGVVKTAFRDRMQKLASEDPPARFNTQMQVTYGLPPCPPNGDGDNATVFNAYKALQTQAKDGKLSMPPNVDVVSRAQLGGANGAYVRPNDKDPNSGRILLADDLGDQPDLMMDVFTEEMFHHLDHDVSTQVLQATQNINTADLAISKTIGPLNNAREEVLSGANAGAQKALASGNMAELQKALAPDVKIKVNAWLKDQMGPAMAKGKDGLADAQKELAARLVNCGVSEQSAPAQAAAMLTAGSDGQLKLGSVSDEAVGQMVSLMTKDAKPNELPANRGPSGALNGPNKPSAATADTLNKAMNAAKIERSRSRDVVRDPNSPTRPELDAKGDEGRAGLYALKAMFSNMDMRSVSLEADRGRGEELNVDNSGAIRKSDKPEIRDQGIAGRNIVVDGQVVVAQGTRMEFNSTPAKASATASVGGAIDGANPGAAPTSLNPYRSQAREMEGMPSNMLQPNIDKLKQYQAKANANPPQPVSRVSVSEHMSETRQQFQNASSGIAQRMFQLPGGQDLAQLQQQYQQIAMAPMPPAQANGMLNTLAAQMDEQLGQLAANPQTRQAAQELQAAIKDYRGQVQQFLPLNTDAKLNGLAQAGEKAAASKARNSQPNSSELSDNFAPVAHSREELGANQTMQSAAYDEKKGKGSSVASLMLDLLPKGMQSAGQLMIQAAEGWQKQIKELYKNIIKPITKAEEAIYGGAGPWDNDVAVGRPQNYDELQTNKRFQQSTPMTGQPDYGKQAREQADRQRQAEEAQKKGKLLQR